MCTLDDLEKKIDLAVDKYDKAYRRQDKRIDGLVTEVGKTSSDAHDASMSSAETKAIVISLKEWLEREHKEDREDKKEIWGEIDDLKAAKNKMYGIVILASIMIPSAIGYFLA